MTTPTRVLDTSALTVGDTTEVFGWYDKQEWVKVQLVRQVRKQATWSNGQWVKYGSFEVQPVGVAS